MRIASCKGSGWASLERIYHAADLDVEVKFYSTPTQAKNAKYDRLLLLGGCDIHPRYYHDVNRYCYHTDTTRDATEWILARRALEEGIPALGICRGHQMLSIAAGGSLFQDIYHDEVIAPFAEHEEYHEIEAYDDLAWLPNVVNSYHHQAVSHVPPGFEIGAMSLDGVIEAVYGPKCLGVQWHPEMMWEDDNEWLLIFEWLYYGLA